MSLGTSLGGGSPRNLKMQTEHPSYVHSVLSSIRKERGEGAVLGTPTKKSTEILHSGD